MSRLALVTGAARGIGAATVAVLAAEGWRVLALDRCADDPRLPYPLAGPDDLAASVAAANRAAGATAGEQPVRAHAADAAEQAAISEAVGAAEEWGGLDAVVACAGTIAGGAPAWELDPGAQQAVLEANLGATIAAARAAVPALLRRPRPRAGRFVAVSSAAAARGMPGLAAYCAAKAGIEGFVRALAADLRGSEITANAVAPGSTRTPLLTESARLYDLDDPERFAAQQPLERLLEPAEVAAMIAWLLSPAAAGVTGAALRVDGGLSL